MLSRGKKILSMLKKNDNVSHQNRQGLEILCDLTNVPVMFEDGIVVDNNFNNLEKYNEETDNNIIFKVVESFDVNENQDYLDSPIIQDFPDVSLNESEDCVNSIDVENQDCVIKLLVNSSVDKKVDTLNVVPSTSNADVLENPKIHPNLSSRLVPYDSSDHDSLVEDETYEPESEITDSDNEQTEIQKTTTRNQESIDENHELINNMQECRKRQISAAKDKCKREKNKKLRMQGKQYLGFTKKRGEKMKHDHLRDGRSMKPACNSLICKSSKKKRNCLKFTEKCRQEIFDTFWTHMNWKQRKVFVASHVNKIPTKTPTKNNSRRKGTFEYFFNDGQHNLQVCRKMFVNTLDIGYKTVQEWVNKSSFGMTVENTSNVSMSESVSFRYNVEHTFLNTFFDKLPKLPAHYCRRDSMKLYLENSFATMMDLYKFYKSTCEKENHKPLSRNIFNKTFREKNLSIYQQKKDQCNTCFSFKYGNVSEQEYKNHIERKEKARKNKTEDKERAENGECVVLTMDLQAVKLCPFIPANQVYFKTKLCCHNFTVYDLSSKDATCYWFSEDQINELKASTFTSCIIDYITENCLSKKVPIIIYSDGCGYQNRNQVLSNALLNLAIQHGITIFQKYLEPGHTQMECDSVHSLIERKLKNKEIHLPSDYATITKEARSRPKPYIVKILDFSFFKDYSQSEHLRYSSIRPGKMAFDPVINDIKCIQYSKEGKITVKLDYEQEFMDLPVRPKRMGVILDYPPLLNAPCKIKKEKFQHLQELKSVLPKDTHHFYDNLLHN